MREKLFSYLALFVSLAIVGGVSTYLQQRGAVVLQIRILNSSYVSKSGEEIWYLCGPYMARTELDTGNVTEDLSATARKLLEMRNTGFEVKHQFAKGWNVKENTIKTEETAEEQVAPYTKKDGNIPIKIPEILIGLAGGITGGISLKEIPNILLRTQKGKSKGSLEIVIMAASVISGYAFGYFIVDRFFQPECDSEDIKKALKEKSTWKTVERLLWLTKYGETGETLEHIKVQDNIKALSSADEEAFLKLSNFYDELRKNVKNESYDFVPADFVHLDRIHSEAKQILTN